jgi:hypothetical protein
VAAVALLALSTVAALAAAAVGTVAALVGSLVVVLPAAWATLALGHHELLDERRLHAEERVEQARAFRALFVARSAEQAVFASRLRDRLAASDRLAAELRGILRLAEARGDEAEDRARSLRARAVGAEARVAELEAELGGRRPELIDELAAWEVVPGVDADTVVDLLAWEERAGSAGFVEQRRRA